MGCNSMKSMTGYGRAHSEIDGREITVELRAVNHRYLDVSVKYPRIFGYLEDTLKKAAAARIARGKVDVFVKINSNGAADTTVRLNIPLARQYFEALTTLSSELGLKDEISTITIAKMPDVLVGEQAEVDADALSAAVLSVFDMAVSDFDVMREREGVKMAADVREKAAHIEMLVGMVEERAPKRVEEYRGKLFKKMQEVLADTTVDESRIISEAAIYADRVAVDEETVRLRSHLHQLDIMLNESNPVGRKLDFLVQEMNREANTIGSKSNDSELARIVVELKSDIEKIREQIQNIE